MKKIYIVLTALITITTLNSFGQNINRSGLYSNVSNKNRKMEVFSNDNKHYIVCFKEFYNGTENSFSNGYTIENNNFMFLYGPFVSYGEEGYFFEKQGKNVICQ